MSITKESLTSARDAAILCANLACAVHAGIRSEAKPDVSEELRLLPDAVDKANSLLKETLLGNGTAHQEALELACAITFVMANERLYPDPIAFLASQPYPDYRQLCKRIRREHDSELKRLDEIRELSARIDAAKVAAPPQPVPDESNSIIRIGKMWEIRFGTERGQYANKCIGKLALILSQPNRPLTIKDLFDDAERKLEGDASIHGEREADTEGIRVAMKRLQEIEDITELTGGGATIENEKAELVQFIQDADRQFPTSLGKAHHNLASQLRKQFEKLTKDMPKLASHLRGSITMEKPTFLYSPVPRIDWKI